MHDADRNTPPVFDDSKYRILVEAVTDYAIYMLDADGFVTSWNAGARRLKGYDAYEIVGRHFSLFYTEADRQIGLPARVLETAEREGRFEAEGLRVRKDGETFWAHVVVDPIRDDAGTLIGFAKITRDLTERRASDRALRQSEERFRLLVQGVTDYAIYMLDPNGIVTNWNVGAQRIKGYTPAEIVGEHFSRFYTDEDRAAGLPQKGLDTSLREGRFESEGWRVRKNGERFWANVVIDPIRDDHGVLIGFAKVTRDVSEKRASQLALEQAREAFFQAQKMEAVGQLTGGVAHDFNNLLMAIVGSLDLLRKRIPPDPRSERLIDNAIQAANRGATLTARMLAFARRQDLKLEAVDVVSLILGMQDLLAQSLGGAIRVKTAFAQKLGPVWADANQLELAILNLAVNARDAMPSGGEIVIAAKEAHMTERPDLGLPDGAYVCVSVTDTGEGMDEATLARATDPFFTTKGVGKGTGLGLSMVHGAVEQTGGRLFITSRKGEGTTVELWLPKAAQTARTGSPAPIRSAEPARPEPGVTVLVVDDDELVLLSTVGMLEDLGYNVLAASGAAEALRLIRSAERLDLLLTDQAMPDMTGFELADAARSEIAALPVVIASGFAELPARSFDLPRLAKPFQQLELAQILAKELAGGPFARIPVEKETAARADRGIIADEGGGSP